MKGISRFLMLLLFIVALFAGLVFSGHNQTPVAFWLGTEFAARPLSLWIIAAFISGGLLGLILGLGIWQSRASRKKIKQLQQKLLLAENELMREKQHGSVSKTELKGL
jgi:uncharacterized integral membrane protein